MTKMRTCVGVCFNGLALLLAQEYPDCSSHGNGDDTKSDLIPHNLLEPLEDVKRQEELALGATRQIMAHSIGGRVLINQHDRSPSWSGLPNLI